MAFTAISDVVVPEVFSDYVRQLTEEKSRIVQSGAIARSPDMDEKLAGGGLTFNVPSWRDLTNSTENITTDADSDATVNNIGSDTEICVRLNRNNGWGSYDLASALAGEDPMDVIADRVSAYWARRLQLAVIAMVSGINKDNGVNDSGDYAEEIVGASFVDGVTNFSPEAYIDAAQTMGDSSDDIWLVMVHSLVYARMKKNNLIDFIPDSMGEVNIPTFLGAQVLVDDGMPSGTSSVLANGTAGSAGMYETWLFGPGAFNSALDNRKSRPKSSANPQAATVVVARNYGPA